MDRGSAEGQDRDGRITARWPRHERFFILADRCSSRTECGRSTPSFSYRVSLVDERGATPQPGAGRARQTSAPAVDSGTSHEDFRSIAGGRGRKHGDSRPFASDAVTWSSGPPKPRRAVRRGRRGPSPGSPRRAPGASRSSGRRLSSAFSGSRAAGPRVTLGPPLRATKSARWRRAGRDAPPGGHASCFAGPYRAGPWGSVPWGGADSGRRSPPGPLRSGRRRLRATGRRGPVRQ